MKMYKQWCDHFWKGRWIKNNVVNRAATRRQNCSYWTPDQYSLCNMILSRCCQSAKNVSLPANSSLWSEIMLSTIPSVALYSWWLLPRTASSYHFEKHDANQYMKRGTLKGGEDVMLNTFCRYVLGKDRYIIVSTNQHSRSIDILPRSTSWKRRVDQ